MTTYSSITAERCDICRDIFKFPSTESVSEYLLVLPFGMQQHSCVFCQIIFLLQCSTDRHQYLLVTFLSKVRQSACLSSNVNLSKREHQINITLGYPRTTSCTPSITTESIYLLFTYHVGKIATRLSLETLLHILVRWPQDKQRSVEQG